MAHKRMKTENMAINYKFACRCCLKSEAEFFKLDSLIDCGIGDNDATATKIPLIRLLLFCMRTENLPELPQYICAECSKSLQIAYLFIQNGLRAHEILCRKLCPGQLKSTTRSNGQHMSLTQEPEDATLGRHGELKSTKAAVRHECKVCGAIIYNRMELKQHIRMHTEASRHQCKLCNFVTLKHRQLPEHYRKAHGLTAAQIEHQLKIRRSMQAAANAIPTSTAAATTTTGATTTAADDDQVKVCTLEDMELLIPTVLTPEDFSHPQLDAEQLRDIEQQLANSLPVSQSSSAYAAEPTIAAGGGANVTIGAEFLVLPDGSLQQVNDGGVVFEYIDDSKNIANAATNMTLQSLLGDSKPDLTYDPMDIDLSHMVVDNALPQITVKPKPRPAPASTGALKHKCKLCPKAFPTVARLKSHQLTHSHLPKFYCDQCAYYSLRSADLIQHYTTEHKSCVTESRANHYDKLPGDRSRIYSCDMCLFEAPSSGQLRVHYSNKHMVVPSEVQLRPTWTHESRVGDGNSTLADGNGSAQPDIPLGIKYPPMMSSGTTTEPTATPTTAIRQPGQATTTTVVTPDGEINVVVDATSLFYAAGAVDQLATTTEGTTRTTTTTTASATSSNTFGLFPEQSFGNSMASTTTMSQEPNGVPSTTSASNPNTSIFGDMQDFIDNTDVAAICTIPADDMPVVDGDDIVIDNNNISLDFDAENLFEDFEDVEVGEEDDDDDDDDAENEDENDNNNAAADQNLLLTSDDDDVDDFDDEQSKHLQKPYCIYCNKKFTSQYKFENHMFVHRGLAPYRCELCTNLYNMKRLLIRHYKTVHKRMPTRDMVQAKGDKVSVASTTIEKIQVNNDKPPMLMCAKCPFECELESEMRKHLNAHHGINDGVSVHANEVFIIRKLPYECPRCIRSFAAKRTLTRHLQRSHLVDTIIEMQAPQLTTSSAATTTTSTATTTLPLNASDGNKTTTTVTATQLDSNMLAPQDAETVDGDGDGDGKCEENALNKETGSKTENLDTFIRSETTTTATQETNVAATTDTTSLADKAEAASVTTTEAAEAATTTSAAITTTENTSTTSATTTTTTNAGSTLFPTPTPFDFDLDFIGNGAQAATPIKINNNDNFNIAPNSSHLLNGSDKLLTAALEPSPVKDLRTRLPRTPIFVCKQCNQTFDELGKLLQHELDQHSSGIVSPRSSYQHQCKICKTTYRTITLLNYHMKRHAPVKIPCKQCSKEFEESSDLEQHIQSEHSANMPLQCGVDGCTKTFAFKHHLKRHQTASHTPVQYICPECGCDMLTSLQLRNHLSTHKGTHSYKCPKCVRTYLRRKPFRRHALREHKWELTEEEIDKIYCLNSPSPSIKLRERRSVKAERDRYD